MSSSIAVTTCLATIGVILLGAMMSLGIAAVSVASSDGNDSCIGTYRGISFSYGTWLTVYGATQIATIGSLALIGLAWLGTRDDGLSCPAIFILVLGYGFQFAFYIVGSILYFNEVHNNCDDASPIHKLGLALFIIQTIVFISACLGGSNA